VQPSDWLVDTPGRLPLECVATISDPAISQVVLACIRASPGGFPAHAVAASAGALHVALQHSTAAFVKVLLDAGADPNVGFFGRTNPMETPLNALALVGENYFEEKLSLLLAAGARLEAVNSHIHTAGPPSLLLHSMSASLRTMRCWRQAPGRAPCAST